MIKMLAISLLVACSSASATPDALKVDPTMVGRTAVTNRVCAIAHGVQEGTCDDLAKNAEGHDVAEWHHDGGTKICVETYDAKLKEPLTCWILKPSPKEQADMTLAEERAKAAAAQPAPAALVPPLAHTAIPTSKK